ncbi:MAG TPA: alkaline phosphatase family protein [Candidatus Binataceae bacterium]|nr:alkaline phosphatase family protein [Candidatus Binataceae bacterium]
MAVFAAGAAHAGSADKPANPEAVTTTTPIKHVVLIIGENRTFDHVFGTFVPKAGQTVSNLLSKGIVNADGSPGPNFSLAQQWQASDTTTYSINPAKTSVYSVLPDVNTDGTPTAPLFSTVAAAEAVEPALQLADYVELTTGGSGLPSHSIDTRFGASPQDLPNGPFDITHFITYDDYAGSPVHRFFQMWQQLDCDITKATAANPSGCQEDLFPWVEDTIGAGSNGNPQPVPFTDETTNEGSIAMGFYNVAAGDESYFDTLAHQYALSDNYHQAIEGGTGANHLAIGYGQGVFYADSNGNPATPPANQIENPDPQAGTNNYYTQDGYGGGSYINCADSTQPGVSSVTSYLNSLPYKTWRDCAKGAYYLVNNYNPGYLGNGTPAPLGPTDYTIPPTQQKNIGTLLTAHGISWKYYGEGWAKGAETGEASSFCNICDPFLYSTQIMTNPRLRANNQDIQNLYEDIRKGKLPSVSIVKPDGYLDGHPASSKFELFEGFTKKIIDNVKANPALWGDTAILITVDEGGGYYDSGYVQPIDAFGDGTRIPMLAVSPFSKGVGMAHSYADHVSFAKFVEANWAVPTISPSSRDNLPNPTQAAGSYAPTNAPAIGDLMDMFRFPS